MKDDKGNPGMFPNRGAEPLDRAGIRDRGYLDKKGTPSGDEARFNFLPPGMNIEDQHDTDIPEQPLKMFESGSLSYPGDGGFADRPKRS
jgi:hypothetical protein